MIRTIVDAYVIYMIAGLVLLPFFEIRGLSRIDQATDQSTLGFRVLVAPGLVLLWPAVLVRWILA